MGKCPLYTKCTIGSSQLQSVGLENQPLQRNAYDYKVCRGKGESPDQWSYCEKYNPSKEPDPQKQDRNMKIGIIVGFVMGLIFGIFQYEVFRETNSVALSIGIILILSIVGAIYGIGFSSVSVTINSIKKFIDRSFVGYFMQESLSGKIINGRYISNIILYGILYLLVLPFLVMFFVVSIVGIVRYFIRRQRMKYDVAR